MNKPKRKTTTATWVITIVIVLVVLSAIGAIFGSKQQPQQTTSQSTSAQSSNASSLNNCIDTADSNYNNGNATYIQLADTVQSQQEQVVECKTEYPISASSSYQSQYNDCIGNVDQWWSNNANSIELEQLLTPVKTEMAFECAVRYPTN